METLNRLKTELRAGALGVATALLVLLGLQLTTTAQARAATPTDAIAGLLEAFRTHRLVAITDPHGSAPVQTLLLALIRDERFVGAVDDLVMETLSARYQDVIDRYVRGEDVDREYLRHAWEDMTVPNSLGVQAEEMLAAVREQNRRSSQKLRVLAGDPPIDWAHVTSQEDHFRWISLRDSHPADLIRRQVLDRGRKALIVYGQLHAQRRSIMTNYDMSSWQAQTVISLLERDAGVHVFNIWALIDSRMPVPQETTSWPVPALAILEGTGLGAIDFGVYNPAPSRVSVRNGAIEPLPRDRWQVTPMQDQFDALLYVGPPASDSQIDSQRSNVPDALCRDAAFIAERLRRFAVAGLPPVEADSLKQACRLAP